MTIALAEQDLNHLIKAAMENGCLAQTLQIDGYTLKGRVDPLGEGYLRAFQLRPDLRLRVVSFQSQEGFQIDHCHDENFPIVLVFQLAGDYRVLTYGLDKGHYYERANESYLFFLPNTREIEECPDRTQMTTVRILVAPHLLAEVYGGCPDTLPLELQPFVDGRTPALFHRSAGKMTPAMHLALHQIVNCPYEGTVRQIFLESKVLELMALQFHQLLGATIAQPASSGPQTERDGQGRSPDIQRIHQARDILIENFQNPPTLIELARQVGINDRKLKQGFKQVFGTTVFGYLHDYRIETARHLLERDQMTVTGVAQAVGFANRSYFAAAFRKKFGINPGAYRQT